MAGIVMDRFIGHALLVVGVLAIGTGAYVCADGLGYRVVVTRQVRP